MGGSLQGAGRLRQGGGAPGEVLGDRNQEPRGGAPGRGRHQAFNSGHTRDDAVSRGGR